MISHRFVSFSKKLKLLGRKKILVFTASTASSHFFELVLLVTHPIMTSKKKLLECIQLILFCDSIQRLNNYFYSHWSLWLLHILKFTRSTLLHCFTNISTVQNHNRKNVVKYDNTMLTVIAFQVCLYKFWQPLNVSNGCFSLISETVTSRYWKVSFTSSISSPRMSERLRHTVFFYKIRLSEQRTLNTFSTISLLFVRL